MFSLKPKFLYKKKNPCFKKYNLVKKSSKYIYLVISNKFLSFKQEIFFIKTRFLDKKKIVYLGKYSCQENLTR